MPYTKPSLTGFWAMGFVQKTGSNIKIAGMFEGCGCARTQPAYEADE